jgi:hypothetical protein
MPPRAIAYVLDVIDVCVDSNFTEDRILLAALE